MCIRGKTGKGSVNIVFIPVLKPHAHKLYIVRHCTNMVYEQIKIITNEMLTILFDKFHALLYILYYRSR